MSSVLDPIRFGPERDLIGSLFDRFGLDVVIDHFVESGGVRSMYDAVLASELRLTRMIAPRLMDLLDAAREKLAFDEPLEMFVGQNPQVNAAAMHRMSGDEPHVLSLTSALVERMTDAELSFVLGHELGHLAYRHYRARLADAAFGRSAGGESKAPPLLLRRLESWDRMAEISADRAGFSAVDGNLEVAVSAFFKLQSGLGPEHLRFDIAAILEQLESLQKASRRELFAEFSHPATPIRVRALQLFGEVRSGQRTLAAVDAEVAEIARLMDYAASEPLDVNAREFILAGGLLAAYADGDIEMDDAGWNTLVQLLLPVSADPEAEVARIKNRSEADEILEKSAAWLRDNAGEERFDLLRAIAHVTAADGHLSEAERAFLKHCAELLGVPARTADEIAFETLADHLQTHAGRGMRPPRFALDE
ncbi:MAG: M48 family metalloprotease [Polyangiaceae bacterium]|nr:M48 family metalloprotease [Polyangiaceae bacterium]MCL4750843.1 M48 family metalloprotease [Myxococcales bacterium]